MSRKAPIFSLIVLRRDGFGTGFSQNISRNPLREALVKAIGGKLLGDSRRRLLIPSLNAARGEIYIYKTRHHKELKTDWRVPAINVALATSAAPSYFPIHSSINNIPFIEGGIWANNPTGLAAIEAVTLLGQRPADVRILSLGCTQCPVDLRPRFAGKLGWSRKALEAAISGQSGGSMGIAHMLIGHPAVIRVDPVVDSKLASLDRTKSIKDLAGLGYSEARQQKSALDPVFFQEEAAEFTPPS